MQRHLFMAYSSNYTQMSPQIRNEVRDCLVFDMDRHSIYAQNEEFGYVGNALSEVTVRNANDDDESTIILTTYNGITYLSEYIPISFDKYTAKINTDVLSTSSVFEAGTVVNLTYMIAQFKGTGPVTYYWANYTDSSDGGSILHNITTKPTDTNINCVTNDKKWHAVPDDTTLTVSLTTNADEYTKTIECIGFALDDRMKEQSSRYAPASKTLTIEWRNHIIIGNISGENGGKTLNSVELLNEVQSSTLSNILSNDTTGTNLTTLSQYRNILSSDYRCETKENPIDCDNGVGTYVFLAIPSALADSYSIGVSATPRKEVTGILGGAAVQEFSTPIRMSYTNGHSFTTDYDFFIATGQNWTGKTLSIS